MNLLIFFLLFACSTKKEISLFDKQFKVQKIAPHTFVVTDTYFHDSNVLVAQFDNTVLIASSPFETQGSNELMIWIKEKFKPKKMIAINTHFHFDGTGGNEAYANHGVEIWASEKTLKLHQEKGEYYYHGNIEMFKDRPHLQERLKNSKIVFATHLFKDNKSFTLGSEKVEIIYPGPAHSPDNVAVFIPKRGVLFGGCMIKTGDHLGYLGDADIKSWPKSAEKLKSLNPKIVIPGHGDVGGINLIENTLQLAKKPPLTHSLNSR